jgi:hypothetical protein
MMKITNCTGGQMNTLEGLIAALLMIFAVLFISKSAIMTTPQSGEFIDTQLELYGKDAFMLLDQEDYYTDSRLKKYVAGWDGIEANQTVSVSASLNNLDEDLKKLIPDNVQYNVDFLYAYSGSVIEKPVIFHGIPPDNSVTVFQLVTLYDESSEMRGDFDINENNTIPDTDHDKSLLYNIVQVRCTLWYV